MKQVIYAVHSDVDENNVGCEFTGRGSKQKAIKYAKENIGDKTWVEKLEFDTNTEQYEYCGGIFSYDEEK